MQNDNTFQAFLLRHGKRVLLKARKPICINNRGQVLVDAGLSTLSSSYDAPIHFVLLSRGARIPIENARTGTELDGANALNDAGTVAGAIDSTACIWKQGLVTKLGRFGSNESEAVAINNREQVVGYSHVKPGKDITHAFVWQNGRMTDLNTLIPAHSGWVLTEADAINDRGQIVCAGNKGACLLTPITSKRRKL